MIKIKNNKSAAKRFKKIANGFKYKKSFKSHILTNKSTKRKRHLKHKKKINFLNNHIINRLLPNF